MYKPSVEKIKKLIPFLPSRDVELGFKFLNARDFESLQSLVCSAIIKVKKGLLKEHPKEEYLQVDKEKLARLKMEVDSYYSLIDISDIDTEYEEFNNEFEDYYQ